MSVLSIKEILEKGDYLITYQYDTKYEIGKISISWTKETFILKYAKGKLSNNFTNEVINCREEYAKGYAYLILNSICKKYNYPLKFVKFVCDGEEVKTLSFNDATTNSDFFYLVKDFYEDGLKPTHYELAKLHGIELPMKDVIHYYMGMSNE